jgi:hypothetical protein
MASAKKDEAWNQFYLMLDKRHHEPGGASSEGRIEI